MAIKQSLILGIFGLIAGFLSSLIFSISQHDIYRWLAKESWPYLVSPTGKIMYEIWSYSPGLIFGIFIALYFLFFKKTKAPSALAFIIISTIAFIIAVKITHFFGLLLFWFSVFLGGALGALIMLLGYNFFLSRLKKGGFIILILLGSLLSFTIYLNDFVFIDIWLHNGGSAASYNERLLYLVWQTGMALGLALFTKEK